MGLTENGFSIGDKVELPDNRTGHIIKAAEMRINYHRNDFEFYDATAVLVNTQDDTDEWWLDVQLTRI